MTSRHTRAAAAEEDTVREQQAEADTIGEQQLKQMQSGLVLHRYCIGYRYIGYIGQKYILVSAIGNITKGVLITKILQFLWEN